MIYSYVKYNASASNIPLIRYKLQKQYVKGGKKYDIHHNGNIIPFKEPPIKMIQTLNNKKL